MIDHASVSVSDPVASKAFYEAALAPLARAPSTARTEAARAAGGTDNGGPGERPHYHPGYYGAFVLDPDGNNLEAVFHGAGD